MSVLSEGSAKPATDHLDVLPAPHAQDLPGQNPQGVYDEELLSPEEKERKEIGSLPSHLQNLSGISEASTGRPKILLDNMQTQAQAFIREVNIIKIQRAVRAFMARLYVNYLRAERAVKDRCEMLIMYSAISEINTLMSVQVATEVYSENKKVDRW